ncbi:hypothetical protein [Pseudooceanicola sediminis]|uniref:hypothetical protein n=1 Tax=Pseudooceanicola sediminis TaxID=2211117 RepID=UPI001313E21B|nr:hypothetical protein [Pseudooceanicola sediminis]
MSDPEGRVSDGPPPDSTFGGFLRHMWHDHRLGTIAFLAAMVLVVLFALRLMLFSMHYRDGDWRNPVPEAWMTPAFVAHAWHVPRPQVYRFLSYRARPDHALTLSEIAERQGMSEDELLTRLNIWLLEWKLANPATGSTINLPSEAEHAPQSTGTAD